MVSPGRWPCPGKRPSRWPCACATPRPPLVAVRCVARRRVTTPRPAPPDAIRHATPVRALTPSPEPTEDDRAWTSPKPITTVTSISPELAVTGNPQFRHRTPGSDQGVETKVPEGNDFDDPDYFPEQEYGGLEGEECIPEEEGVEEVEYFED
ncbi:hypothetical protein GUJ93_ZPchr0006g45674 [Zizania palustris]|uniref:Uncharacterized protein n=1 Tax=Zizania palustris TaxID=103762 RepID=A0A8J5W2V8_ZIZPA|nr:hypothetical protein GUJ93_ZPchr0006g45674 [Zizania palustris]